MREGVEIMSWEEVERAISPGVISDVAHRPGCFLRRLSHENAQNRSTTCQVSWQQGADFADRSEELVLRTPNLESKLCPVLARMPILKQWAVLLA